MGILLTNMQLEALSLNPVLSTLFQSVKLPIDISFRLTLLRDKLSTFMEAYLNVKEKYAKKYCDLDDKGNLIIENNTYKCTDVMKLKELNKELGKLLSQEIEISMDRIVMPIKEFEPLNMRATVGEIELLKLVLDIQ